MPRSKKRFVGRKPLVSMCWCTASPSATTWWSTSANAWTASPSLKTAGCRATARAASSRRSSTATSRRPAPMTVEWSAYAQSLTDAGR